MNSIEIVVQTYKDYINYEQWLFSITFPERLEISIFCMENAMTYFYKTTKVQGRFLASTKDC